MNPDADGYTALAATLRTIGRDDPEAMEWAEWLEIYGLNESMGWSTTRRPPSDDRRALSLLLLRLNGSE